MFSAKLPTKIFHDIIKLSKKKTPFLESFNIFLVTTDHLEFCCCHTYHC